MNEARNVAENVGLLDMTAFAKCRVSGPGAEVFLDNLLANRLPKKIGRVGLSQALNTRGGVHSEFTIIREAPESYYLVSAGAFQRLDHDWIKKHMPADGSVQFENLTGAIGVSDSSACDSLAIIRRERTSVNRSQYPAGRPCDVPGAFYAVGWTQRT